MILNACLPYDPFAQPRLPGVAPLESADWLHADEAYDAQMAERRRLLSERRGDVLWQEDGSGGGTAAGELLDTVLETLPAGFRRDGDAVLCPDGRRVKPDRHAPLETLGSLVQEDFCLLEKRGEEHVLIAAILCFPAGWMLSEKAGRPLTAIHAPVDAYDESVARRVQRLFDGVQVGGPLWRFNALWYDDPALFQPHPVKEPRPAADPARAPFFRSERQCILRLPRTGAVVFSIHTRVLPRAAVSAPAADTAR